MEELSKVCTSCKEEKVINKFRPAPRGKYKCRSQCRSCESKASRARQFANSNPPSSSIGKLSRKCLLDTCGKTFNYFPYREKTALYCSRRCAYDDRKPCPSNCNCSRHYERTLEMRERMSAAAIASGIIPPDPVNNNVWGVWGEYQGVKMRSGLERTFAARLDKLRIAWVYEPERFKLGSFGTYLPDFWLPAQNLYVEIKGSQLLEKSKAKMDEFVRLGNSLCYLQYEKNIKFSPIEANYGAITQNE